MGQTFTALDGAIFLTSLLGVMAVGLVAGRREETSEDYFLAGRQIRWWGVAGSIFGSNVSANHVVGMMGIGFTVGFAQSHFELGAIAGLMLLCYGFLPVYRKLRLFTLSDYLRQRYDDRSAALYALLMIIFMVLVQMVQGFYIGSRSLNVFLAPTIEGVSSAEANVAADPQSPSAASGPREIRRPRIPFRYYALGVLALVAVATTYTIVGGLKAVVWTDVIQSVLILVAGIVVALLVFKQPEVGGWSGMRALDSAQAETAAGPRQEADAAGQQGAHKMRLYLPSDHPELPWSGVLTGLMVLHVFYWGTNQFIVQRALGAASDSDARRGIVAAGFLKLLIPFFSVGAGVGAFYLFRSRMPGVRIDSDAAFTEAVKLVVPAGMGIMGIIAAGLIGAILSSIDSMMNSAATLVTFDLYQRYVNPQASQRRLIWVGRFAILGFVTLAATVAIFGLDPNSTEHFFLVIVDQQSYLVPGLVVAFLLGMLWPRATPLSAFVTILAGPIFSAGLNFAYGLAAQPYLLSNEELSADAPPLLATFGSQLNMFHRVAVTVLFCVAVQVITSLLGRPHPAKAGLTWAALLGHGRREVGRAAYRLAGSLALFALLAWAMVGWGLSPLAAAASASLWTLAMGVRFAWEAAARPDTSPPQGRSSPPSAGGLLRNDRFWAGLLCSLAMFMLFYFY